MAPLQYISLSWWVGNLSLHPTAGRIVSQAVALCVSFYVTRTWRFAWYAWVLLWRRLG